ncbi:MAG: UDP-N-acetylenolpyruvoylglucosamine reductase [Candidatus Levybacteria bacterium RIFCSPHIGHO2_01_FULL_37_17]|nr:MAG: UDP-N-acetylenolpyruvoylglucosamine reductase [Candidatus Levybacteria bacterium RIFCSPHIGHO2_01_FULL_37_17]OGH36844.1 MAG: UDP-N-acetylenolpyruvoylglucosamine reductase [Candidatus Levybacteria bacterium RIFCSPLOWO2_01_FULL_38_23]
MSKIQKDIPLKLYSNLKIGGPAKFFVLVKTIKELTDVLIESKGLTPNVFVIGGGTNILFPDIGFNGLVIKVDIQGIEKRGNFVKVGAGVEMLKLLEFCVANGLSGLEWAGGLPGGVGGAVRGNAGAYTGEMKDSIFEVESIDMATYQVRKRSNAECKFGYRNSIFKQKLERKEAIAQVTFKLNRGDKDQIIEAIEDKISKRKLRHPLDYPNLGSIFQNTPIENFPKSKMNELAQYIKNDPFPVIPTAKINFLAGLSGKRVGDAQLSEKHTNFIINLGNAKAEEVKQLILIIKSKIKEVYEVELKEEISYLN